MSNYQNLDRQFAQMRVHEQGGEFQRMPPATAPKPKSYTAAPAPFKSGGASYRAVNVDSFPPPPPAGYGMDERSYPPPPPPEPVRGYQYHEPDQEFPPPPPPAPSQDYGYNQSGGGGSGVYTAQAKYVRQDDYNDFGPGPMTPPSRASDRPMARGVYSQEGRESPYSPQNVSSGNYANIRINVAPPTPTNKEFDYGGSVPSPPQQYRTEPSHVDPRQDRPKPGPQVPSGDMSRGGAPYGAAQISKSEKKADKEAEVDALTDMLMKSMESAHQDDFFGICGHCEKEVTGESNGCSAMDQVFHVKCFTCVGCNVPLQGKSFFAMETKPYCENCYINTLEKCSICSKPITDRLLRATGKPYHPDCFTCVVCGKSLDGIPFTVDATNQIHCIEDFHKKFAPRCCVCQQPIMPRHGEEETVRIVAMDKSFHIQCYRCEDCGLELSSEAEGRGCYPLDDHILCKNCNAARIQAMTTKMATEL